LFRPAALVFCHDAADVRISAHAATDHDLRRQTLLAAGLIALLTFVAYANGLGGPFLYDDIPSIVQNPTIRRLGSMADVLWPPRAGGITVSGRPFLNLTLALNYASSGEAVRGFHLTNVLIHAAAALALFGIVRRTLLTPRLRDRFGADAALPIAFVSSLLWAVHPLHTEAVSYVVQRAESLMGCLYLVTLYGFIRGAEAPRNRRRWFAVSLIACSLGMATKEVMVSAPLLVLLYDRTFIAGSFRAALACRGRVYAALAASWVLLLALVLSLGGNRGGSIGPGVGISWVTYWMTQPGAIAHYVRLVAWPEPLVFDYATRWTRSIVDVLPAAALLVGLGVGTIVALRRSAAAGFIGAWFFAILAPTSVMPGPAQLLAEHRMYLPTAAIAAGALALAYRFVGRRLLGACAVMAIGLVVLTSARNAIYADEVGLWQDTLAHSPGNIRAEKGLANALSAAGKLGDAVTHYEAALRLAPDDAAAHTNFANTLLKMGRPEDALAHFRTAAALQPGRAETHNNLGTALASRHELDAAIAEFHAAIRLRPSYAEAFFNLGTALQLANRFADAVPAFQRVLELQPDYPDAEYDLAVGFMNLGRPADAIIHYRRALEQKDDPEAHNNLGALLAESGQFAEAILHFKAVLQFHPDDADARRNLNRAEAELRQQR
jgi:protein O-mannosyl-transferase